MPCIRKLSKNRLPTEYFSAQSIMSGEVYSIADLVSGLSFSSLVPRARTGFLLVNPVRPSGEEGEVVAEEAH